MIEGNEHGDTLPEGAQVGSDPDVPDQIEKNKQTEITNLVYYINTLIERNSQLLGKGYTKVNADMDIEELRETKRKIKDELGL